MSVKIQKGKFLLALEAKGRSPATLKIYGDSLLTFERFLVARKIRDVRQVSVRILRKYQDWLIGRSYAPATRASILSALRLFLLHLAEGNLVSKDLSQEIIIPKVPDRLPQRILTQEEVSRIMDAPDSNTAKGLRDRAILETFYSTGLRKAEMTALSLLDVDLANGLVRVNHGKGGHDRVVPLGKRACNAVRVYLETVRNRWRSQNHFLWLSYRSPHPTLSKYAVGTVVRDAAKKAGLEGPIHPHALRHSCATHMVQCGSDIAFVQRLLGHQSLRTTQRYTHVAVTDLVAMLSRFHPRK